LNGDDLARSISEDHLPWDPSVQALLPFASVLDLMARDSAWTTRLGDAFLAQHDQVIVAARRMRQKANDFGYLRSNGQIQVIAAGPAIEIVPVNPAFYFVPVYDPWSFWLPQARFPDLRRHFIRPRNHARHRLRAVGLGRGSLGLGTPHRDHQQSSVGPNHRQSQGVRHPYSLQRYRPEHREEHHELRGRERR
jgi:hypothetical protein